MNNFTPLRPSAALLPLYLILAISFVVPGCGAIKTAAVGDLKTETKSVELGGADSAVVRIHMGVGALAVAGGAGSLMDATFRYNVDAWQPRLESSANGGQSVLLVHQEDSDVPAGVTAVNDWSLRLNSSVPLELEIETGTVENDLDLRGLDLTNLEVNTGVGSITIDLSGDLQHDLNASVNGGLGKLSIKVPATSGLRVSAASGVDNLAGAGLIKDGDYYVNKAYGVAPHTLFLDINAGAGGIELLAQ